MAITASQLLSKNGGRLPLSLFDEKTEAEVLARLDAHAQAGNTQVVADGIDAADEDKAAKAWAYFRVFEELHTEAAVAPSSATIEGEGSASHTTAQLEALESKMNAWKDVYDAFVPVVEKEGVEAGYQVVKSLR